VLRCLKRKEVRCFLMFWVETKDLFICCDFVFTSLFNNENVKKVCLYMGGLEEEQMKYFFHINDNDLPFLEDFASMLGVTFIQAKWAYFTTAPFSNSLKFLGIFSQMEQALVSHSVI